jgi:hypothetical protein
MNEHENGPRLGELAHAGLRGVIAAMAMSGMRACTKSFGLIKQAPPQAIFRQRAKFLLWSVPRKRRRAVEELTHWGYGAVGGVTYGALPDAVRRRVWSGPIFGRVLWLSFEMGLAPLLGLKQSRQLRPVERATLAADHLLYGLVLSETHSRPRE